MSGIKNHPTSIRGAAEALIGQIDRAAELMPIVADITEASEQLRDALAQPEVSRADILERANWAEEGIKLMREQQPVLPIHIQAIVEAAEAGLQAHRSFGVRWDADMRAIDRWRSDKPSRDILELIEAGKAVVAADERATAELAEIGISADQQGLAVQLSQRLKAAIDDVLAYSIEAAVPAQREIMLPDHADLVVWLLALLDRSVDRSVYGFGMGEVSGAIRDLRTLAAELNRDDLDATADLIDKMAEVMLEADRRRFLAEQRAIPDDLEAQIAEHLEGELGDSYDCTRVWEAWSVGTMSADDFEPLSERLGDLAAGLAARIAPFSILGAEPVQASGIGQERIAGSDGPLIINLNRDTEEPIEIINGKSSGPVPGVYSEDQASIARVGERLELAIADAKPGAWPFPPGRDVAVKIGEDTYIGRVEPDGAIRFEEE